MDCVCPERNNFIYLRKNYVLLFIPEDHPAYFFINITSYLIEIVFSSRALTVISDRKEDSRRWMYSLMWNHIEELEGSEERIILPIDDITSPIDKQPLRIYLPLLTNCTNAKKTSLAPHPVYIGRVFTHLNIEDVSQDALVKDKTSFVINKNISDFVLKRNITRLFFARSLKNYYGETFGLYGKGWSNYGLQSERLGMLKHKRHNVYSQGGICVDFLSQHGNNCLYERTIDIINSGAILVQRKSYDSEHVFGKEFSDKLCWDSLEELIDIIDSIMNNGLEYYSHLLSLGKSNIKIYQEKRNSECVEKCISRLSTEK
ncbi:hypothetical protein [Prochlorococcus sp. MIT 1307]|uniref:hypothetical protein n=1 Tax=Prochlorococcus sp. MIT 1307 TaxID=3096219 RepID=UPI002A753D95|nr:hypothetical protein [Prochlorococcus sp. MIT 1307]